MLVGADGRFAGTIGGGTLEWQALAQAQRMIRADHVYRELDFALGPDLGQCCGGRVTLGFELVRRKKPGQMQLFAERAPAPPPLLLFGAGHVGRALVLALAPLPFDVRWIDPRKEAFPGVFPPNATPVAPADPVTEIRSGPSGVAGAHPHA